MEGFQFIDIIILAMAAGFIVLRLRSGLGRRTGHDPDAGTRDNVSPPDSFGRPKERTDNVVNLLPRPIARRPKEERRDATSSRFIKGTPLEPGLVQIKLADPSFFRQTRFPGGRRPRLSRWIVAALCPP